VPKSRVRKRTVYTPPPRKSARRKVSPPWVGPTIVALLVAVIYGPAPVSWPFLTRTAMTSTASTAMVASACHMARFLRGAYT